jgi:tRNA pseudouridine synthase 8/2,5-diamino-6-(5-phospho-D-ribitylamino)-pyrimidin-4(3H)-one deaminase
MSKQPKRQRTSRRPENAPKNNFLTPIIRSVSGGLRYVDEYEYEFNAFAKGRWINRSLLEVCTKEFMAQTPEYYKLAIEEGRITVNGKQISVDYILDHNDLISHKAVCHENPVSGESIPTVYEDDVIVAVRKPCSIPVHPCGGYRLNTLVSILQHERQNSEPLLPAHRIDRLTSGLVVLGKTGEAASKLSKAIQDDPTVIKEYLALVKGHMQAETAVKGYITCVDFRVGKFVFSEKCDENSSESKFSETHVEPVKYFPDRDETLVKCRPITGRTHQIRLHLQSLGHPISNDICYGGEFVETHPHAFTRIPSLQHDNKDKLFCGGIFLHAWRYQIPSLGLALSAPLPAWAEGFIP